MGRTANRVEGILNLGLESCILQSGCPSQGSIGRGHLDLCHGDKVGNDRRIQLPQLADRERVSGHDGGGEDQNQVGHTGAASRCTGFKSRDKHALLGIFLHESVVLSNPTRFLMYLLVSFVAGSVPFLRLPVNTNLT